MHSKFVHFYLRFLTSHLLAATRAPDETVKWNRKRRWKGNYSHHHVHGGLRPAIEEDETKSKVCKNDIAPGYCWCRSPVEWKVLIGWNTMIILLVSMQPCHFLQRSYTNLSILTLRFPSIFHAFISDSLARRHRCVRCIASHWLLCEEKDKSTSVTLPQHVRYVSETITQNGVSVAVCVCGNHKTIGKNV